MSDGADTPRAILACAAVLLRESSFDDISYRQLGEVVGVSERTVYRHFPTRPHLLCHVAQWLQDQHFVTPAFTTWEGLDRAVEQRLRAFDAAPGEAFLVARAASVSPVSTLYSSFFSEALAVLVESSAPRLNDRDRGRLTAALTHFSSAQFWARCRTGFDADAAQTMEVFRSAARELCRSLPEEVWADRVEGPHHASPYPVNGVS